MIPLRWCIALCIVSGIGFQNIFAEERCTDKSGLRCAVQNAVQSIDSQDKITGQLKPQQAACDGQQKVPDPAVAHLFSDIPLFSERAPVKVTMIGKFPVKQKHEGKIVYEWKGKSVTIPVIFEPRGQYRRTLCDSFPPFKIQFLKGRKGGRLFKNADTDLKFVTHCANPDEHPNGKTAAQRVLQEEMSYRMLLNAGFPGLHTRLADVEYRDIRNSKEVARGTGFFIENIKDFGRRWGKHTTLPEQYDPKIAATLAEVFVGNHDYSLNGHNIRHFQAKSIKHHVPYDFDLSALVTRDAYAVNVSTTNNLRRQSPETVDYFGKLMHVRKDLLQKEVADSLLDDRNRKKFKTHIEKFISAMPGPPGERNQ